MEQVVSGPYKYRVTEVPYKNRRLDETVVGKTAVVTDPPANDKESERSPGPDSHYTRHNLSCRSSSGYGGGVSTPEPSMV